MNLRLEGLSPELYIEENDRLQSQIDVAEASVAAAEVKFAAMAKTMIQALELSENAQSAYSRADEEVRRIMNQVIWSDVEVWDDDADGTLAPQFSAWHDKGIVMTLQRIGAMADGELDRFARDRVESVNRRSLETPKPGLISQDRVSDDDKMVGDTGLEPVTSALSRRRSPS
jgi:hypothetical protein